MNYSQAARSFVFLLPLALPSLGCYRIRRAYSGPDVPPIILAGSDLDELRQRIRCDRYAIRGKVLNKSDNDCAATTVDKTERDNIQQMLLTASDTRYSILKRHLSNNRNALTFGSEMTGITLSAVSAILGDADTKTIVSTASSLVQSNNAAINKDFYANESSAALISTMDALRDAKKTQITKSETKALQDYSFETALNDCLDYDEEGNVQAALLKLATDAGVKQDSAKDALHKALAEPAAPNVPVPSDKPLQ